MVSSAPATISGDALPSSATARGCLLNLEKNKDDDYPTREPVTYTTQQLAFCLSDSFNAEDFTDPMRPLSRSLIGGTINTCKTRIMSFIRSESMYQAMPTRAHHQLILTERPYDGTVAMQYGDNDESDMPNSRECLFILPTTMEHAEYQKTEDQIRPLLIRMVASSGSLNTVSGITADNAAPEGRHREGAPGQPSHSVAPANTSGMGVLNSQNLPICGRMLASENNSQALPPSQGYLPGSAMPARSQQLDQSMLQQQQQQQLQQNTPSQMQQHQQLPLPHVQRSSPMLPNNPLSHIMGQSSNLQMGTNQMVNSKPMPLPLQLMQQQAQQQQQTQLPRKVMMGLDSAMSMGNMGNNVMGLSGLSNVMGMGGVRGISSPMGPISGLGSISPNQMNLGATSNFGAGLRAASISRAQAAVLAKLRMAQQNRAGTYGPQSGIAGMTGNTNQMLPSSAGLSMLGHALNGANMSPLQRNAMGPPKIPGTNFYLNPQQQLQLHQQLQQQLQQQQQQQLQQQRQQMQQQQQQISSPLQQEQFGSPPVVGSPRTMVMPQQQISPQQMGQQTAMSPQQLSSGALEHINNGGNAGAGPASPQLSSQTHESVGSITSSPMEHLQGVNKAGYINNV